MPHLLTLYKDSLKSHTVRRMFHEISFTRKFLLKSSEYFDLCEYCFFRLSFFENNFHFCNNSKVFQAAAHICAFYTHIFRYYADDSFLLYFFQRYLAFTEADSSGNSLNCLQPYKRTQTSCRT
jgi:hypothetical protein